MKLRLRNLQSHDTNTTGGGMYRDYGDSSHAGNSYTYSYDLQTDGCTLHELIRLFDTIDVHFTESDMKYVYRCITQNQQPGSPSVSGATSTTNNSENCAQEDTLRLGSVMLFLSNLLKPTDSR